MLHRRNLHQSSIFKHVLSRNFLWRQLRSKSSRRFTGEEDNHRTRRKVENEEANIYLLKSRGQHLLTNPRILESIVRKSNILPTDTVLEIGPGTGNLTLKLLSVAGEVKAIEIDKRMIEILNKRAVECGLDDKLSVVCQDALKTEFPRFDLMVANIPYGISSPLVAKLVFEASSYRSATLLLQKEFARRLLANPGDSEFNRLAVNVKLMADVEFVMDVSKRDFLPCPKVDSSVVKIHPKASVPDVNLQEWWAFTRTCFTKKNRTLGATFKQKRMLTELMRLQGAKEDQENVSDISGEIDDSEDEDEANGSDDACSSQSGSEKLDLHSFKEMIVDILTSSGFDEKRPSKLSHEELLHLLSLFNQSGISFHRPAKPQDRKQAALAAAYDPT